jgi:ubiquinone/menaquinone biosynthesis C-methylase UbiE
MKNLFNFFQNNRRQNQHYTRLVRERLPTRWLFSCGYYERFDPFLLDRKPFMVSVYEQIFSRFLPKPVDNLLDVGCGTGLYWPVLVKYCKHIVGIDYSEAMISEARRLIEAKNLENVEAIVQNGEDLDFPSESFEIILCMDVLHHIQDIRRSICNFHRLLKYGGRLLAVEPNTLNPLIFLAHLIPSEERLAIKRNYAPVLRRLFSPYFKNIQIEYVNFVASADSEKQLKRVETLSKFIMSALPIFKPFSLRQVLIMEKRNS